MKSAKTTIGLIFAILPILYFGGMAYFVWGAPGRLESAMGLPSGATGGMMKDVGPTVLGLGAFALLFAFGFVIRLMRAATGKAAKTTSADAEFDDGEPFDADAALARYLAKKAAGELDAPVAASPTPSRGFGRKGA